MCPFLLATIKSLETKKKEEIDNNSSSIRSIWLYCLSNGPKLMCVCVYIFYPYRYNWVILLSCLLMSVHFASFFFLYSFPFYRGSDDFFFVLVAYFSISSAIIAIVICLAKTSIDNKQSFKSTVCFIFCLSFFLVQSYRAFLSLTFVGLHSATITFFFHRPPQIKIDKFTKE